MKKNLKNIFYIAFTAAIMLAALVPLAAMPFYENSAADAEKRELAPKPSLITEKGVNSDFGTEFEAFFQDRFAFRSELVNAHAEIMLKVFNSSSEDSVLAGKDDWLFFRETLGDYCGTELLSDEEIQRLVTVIKLEQQYCNEQGVAYVFAVAPNKNTIYPEYMQPQYVKYNGKTNLDRLNEALKEAGVNVADLKTALLEAKGQCAEGETLYYSADSHWNQKGALVGYNTIMEAANRFSETEYDNYETVTFEEGSREGDLLKMVLPLDCEVKEFGAKVNISQEYKYIGRLKSIDDMRIQTKLSGLTEESEKTGLLMFRDSFGRALIPIFSNEFSDAVYLRPTPFNIYGNIEGKTVVVREIVERNIPTLLEKAPVVIAGELQEADMPYETSLVKITENNSVIIEEEASSGKPCHVYGFYTEKDAGERNYRVFAKQGDKFYEGFPVYEDALTEENGEQGADRLGFSFYFEAGDDADLQEAEYFFCYR